MTLEKTLDADWDRLQALCGRTGHPRTWRSCFSPRFSYVAIIRAAYSANSRGWTFLAKALAFVNFTVFGIEVPTGLVIGPGLVIPHPQGTILGAAVIGANVTIYQQVTLGAKSADFNYDLSTRPVIEDGVTITAGAKILGAVRLSTNCTIGANAVVLMDIPPDSIAVGVPARVLVRSDATRPDDCHEF